MSETAAVRRRMNIVWMINDGHMIPKAECGLNDLTCVLQLRKKKQKNLNQEIDPTEDRTRVRWVRGNLPVEGLGSSSGKALDYRLGRPDFDLECRSGGDLSSLFRVQTAPDVHSSS